MKNSTLFLRVCVGCAFASLTSILCANWWERPTDYWLMWVAGLSLIGVMAFGIATVCAFVKEKKP
jgi:drug/metabolite transporter (DMT)-like permease